MELPNIQHLLRCEIDPSKPIQEINGVISAVIQCHPGNEKTILEGVAKSISDALKDIEHGQGGEVGK